MGNIAVCATWSVGDAQNCSILLALLKPPHGCLQLCYCPLSVPDSVAKISGRQGLEVGAWEQNNLEGSGSLCWGGKSLRRESRATPDEGCIVLSALDRAARGQIQCFLVAQGSGGSFHESEEAVASLQSSPCWLSRCTPGQAWG